jgi:L-threonylcarbamoyladenylate synthase
MTERAPFDEAAILRAAGVLMRGGLVAFPTETVYGLGARADDGAAVRRIFEAKGRPPTNPLIVHVASIESARAVAAEWPEAAEQLARAFWPGPLTLIVRRKAGVVVDEVTCGGDTVAVRVPAHRAAMRLLERVVFPVAAPSANRSTRLSPTTAEHVLKSLDGRIDLVLDAGPTGDAAERSGLHGIESTIVDVTRSPAVVLRYGALPMDALAQVIATVPRSTHSIDDEPARAPGAQALHYAPQAPLVIVPASELHAEVAARRAEGLRVGVVDRAPGVGSAPPSETLAADPVGYAAELYAAMHRLDDAGCDVIVAADVPDEAAWAGVRDRLERAAGLGG